MSSGDTKQNEPELTKGDEVKFNHSEKILISQDLMSDAVDGENREHEMSLWQSAKAYPWACMWAFIMCFTIVSLLRCSLDVPLCRATVNVIPTRSWSRSTCF